MVTKKEPAYNLKDLVVPVYIPSALFSIAEGSLIPVIPASAERLGADLATAALITGLLMLGTVLADLPAARFVNHFGERRAMMLGAFASAIGILFSIFAQNIFVLGFGVFVVGAAHSVFGLARHGYIAETVPFSHRARALSMLAGFFRLGSFAGPVLGAGLILLFGIQSVYVAVAVLTFSAGLVLFLTKSEKMQDTPPNSGGGVWHITKRERTKLLNLGTASAILTLARTARVIGLPLWALHIHLEVSQASLIIGIAGALDFALFYLGGKVIDKKGRAWAGVPTLVATGIGLMLIATSNDLTYFLLVALLLAVANTVGSGLVMVIGADLAPADARNEFLAAYRLMLDGGTALAAPTIALATLLVGLSGGLIFIGGLSVLGGWMMFRYLPKHGIK
jgi:MFS family permease